MNSVVRSPRFEPGSSAWQTDDDGQQLPIDWDKFQSWLTEKKYNRRYAADLLSYAKQYSLALLQRDFSKIQDLSDGLRPNVIKGLSALSKFLGQHETFKGLLKSHALKWGGRSADDVIIDRLTKIGNPEEIFQWIKDAKTARPDLNDFLDLLAVSGLRLVETVNCYNLIVQLARTKKLKGYYNEETQSLEHFKFKDTFLRKSKKAFISFVPKDLIARIGENDLLTSPASVQKLIQKKGLQLRFADVREAYASYLTKFLKPEEIDFLQGRCTTSVFMRNYYNPKLVADLEARAFQGIAEIQQKVK